MISAALALIVGGGFAIARAVESIDRTTTVRSAGPASIGTGPAFEGELVAADAELRFTATQHNTRRTPLPPHDAVDLEATATHPDGTRYHITVTDPMIDEPTGQYTTWAGVGFDKWHHRRSGVGTDEVDAIRSEVAINALADVRATANSSPPVSPSGR